MDARPRVTVTPGYEVVSEEQKSQLTALRDEWIRLNNLARRSKISYAAAQTAINRKAGVTSYHLIPKSKFDLVKGFVLQQIARINRTPTARRLSSSWRRDRIKAIQARCYERGFQERRRAYMAERFGVGSMKEMVDSQIEQLYSIVMSW